MACRTAAASRPRSPRSRPAGCGPPGWRPMSRTCCRPAGERVAVTGCGTSWFIAQSYAAAREAAGQGETDAFAASEMPAGRRYDRVVVLSPVRHHDRDPAAARPAGRRRADRGDHRRRGDPGRRGGRRRDRAGLRRRAVGRADQVRHHRAGAAAGPPGRGHRPRWPRRPETALAEPLPAALAGARQFTFLGTGWTYGLASEAALKLREAAGLVDRGLPGDGVPARPDRGHRAGQRRLAARPRPRTGCRPRWPRPAAWPGRRAKPGPARRAGPRCSGWPPRWRGPAGSTRTGRAT